MPEVDFTQFDNLEESHDREKESVDVTSDDDTELKWD